MHPARTYVSQSQTSQHLPEALCRKVSCRAAAGGSQIRSHLSTTLGFVPLHPWFSPGPLACFCTPNLLSHSRDLVLPFYASRCKGSPHKIDLLGHLRHSILGSSWGVLTPQQISLPSADRETCVFSNRDDETCIWSLDASFRHYLATISVC